MKASHFNALSILAMASCLAVSFAASAQAQAVAKDEASVDESEIIVTARKREESILKVPVVVTALPMDKLERLQVHDIGDLPKLVPGLNLGHSLLSIGTLVAIRGVGTSSSDPGVDQSVSLNIDGMSLGNGLAFQSGLFDVQQIEVLKGPQALFYGKSSPGGVISLRTADPTDEVEIVAKAAYEAEAREKRADLIVSGPLSDTLKARLAGYYSAQDGFFKNTAVATPGLGGANPKYRREARSRDYMIRGTLLWNPTDNFSARLKTNFVHDRAINAETSQLANCPDHQAPGSNPFLGTDDCKLDRTTNVVYIDPAFYPGVFNGGVPYLTTNQKYGTLELDYGITPDLSLTSTTGYYNLRSSSMVNATHTAAAGPSVMAENIFRRKDFTQELRLNSSFTGPFDFTLGAFYQDGSIKDRVITIGNTANASAALRGLLGDGYDYVKIKTYSLFGQARWKLTPTLELAGGARWTDEARTNDPFNLRTNAPIPLAVPRLHSSNVSPEATLTYTPSDDLTLFAAYKRGYKSGSFSIATLPAAGADNSFGDERVKGGEIGLKTRMLDHRLLVNLAAYDYRYSGLQVGAIEPNVNGVPVIRTVNAGSARAYGVDFDAAYRPAGVPGLGINVAVNWNHGRYTTLNNVPCYAGQTIAQGCTQFKNPNTGLFTAQDLSGTPLIRAPEWQATFGFDYEMSVGDKLKLIFANSNQYSSKFATLLAVGRPDNDNLQQGFLKTDLSLALRDADERWEVALVGKNVGNKLTSSNCSISNYGGGTQITGGATSGPAGYGEKTCYSERGREVWLRLTYRPFGKR